MLLTTKLRYAIVFMVSLAQESLHNDSPKKMSTISFNQSLPEGYLEHIVVSLKKYNLIGAVKGPGGGYFLNSNPSLITLGLIVDAVGERIKITRCNSNDRGCLAYSNAQCITHNLWHDLAQYIKEYLYNISIKDVINNVFKCTFADNSIIYADYNATSPIDNKIKKQFIDFISNDFYNPSSVHKLGQKSKKIIEDTREILCKSLGAENYSVIFTSSGTEANNLAIKGTEEYHHIIAASEHLSILKCSTKVDLITVDKDGIVSLEHLVKLLKINIEKKILISIALANNETGVIQPIDKIVSIAKQYGAIVHTDATQACGKIPVNIKELGVDMATISAHKFGGFIGAGALILNSKTVNITPIIDGGNQESGLRAGTENVASIYAMSLALHNIANNVNSFNEVKKMRDNIENKILNLAPEAIIFGSEVNRLPNTSCIYMPNVKNEVQLMYFDINNIAVSAGSACSSGKITSSHVLSAMGISEAYSRCSIRISLGPNITETEVSKIIDSWYEIYSKFNRGSLHESQ